MAASRDSSQFRALLAEVIGGPDAEEIADRIIRSDFMQELRSGFRLAELMVFGPEWALGWYEDESIPWPGASA